ncbi:MAG: PP2C family protein-serine/threonine phosphatase [Melioribacteraceae bacterium]|nr:PP2C family protein-serine/threonine phosphatase [Melioribacteraceae bacterium]
MKKPVIVFLTSVIISIPVVYFIFPLAHPYYALKNLITEQEISLLSDSLMSELNINTEDLNKYINLYSNSDLLRQTQIESGIENSNKQIQEGMWGYTWRVRYGDMESRIIIEGQDTSKSIPDFLDELRVDFDQDGKLIYINLTLKDDAQIKFVRGFEAKKIAEDFVRKHLNYYNIEFDSIGIGSENNPEAGRVNISSGDAGTQQDNNRSMGRNNTDYKFNFEGVNSFTGNTVKISVSVKGDIINELSIDEKIPDQFKGRSYFPPIIELIISAVFIIMIIVSAYKRLRAYEIGFRNAIVIGILASLGLMIEILVETQGIFRWELIFGLVLGPLFLGFAIIIIWAISEANGREVWNIKFIEFDLLANGYINHSRIGSSIFYGVSFGLFLLAGWLLCTALLDTFMGISINFSGNDNNDSILIGSFDPFFQLGRDLYRTVFKTALLLGFAFSYLKMRISGQKTVIILTALLWALVNQGYYNPYWLSVIVEFFFGLAFIYIFINYGLFTSLISIFSFSYLIVAVSYFFIGNPDYDTAQIYFLLIGAAVLSFAAVSMYTKDRLQDYYSITPVFAKNITERQRLQGEIQAAKKIQESFLPLSNPDIQGLDIAAKCLPALEVGGDYYDFIKHDDTHLSVIIGDVAGKGTKAAFFMTLTKGFFKALARKISSPAKILCDINELFYENVGRGSFISMIYGQFNLADRTFTYARAGHNPVIHVKDKGKSVNFLQPDGIALGMEKGILFARTIKEEKMPIFSGDLFVFYTDGFTEAMNSRKEQYGEENIMKIVENNYSKSSSELMSEIFSTVLKFIGKEKQYDDMTIVIVKIE